MSKKKIDDLTKEELTLLVNNNKYISEILEKIGSVKNGQIRKHLENKILSMQIDSGRLLNAESTPKRKIYYISDRDFINFVSTSESMSELYSKLGYRTTTINKKTAKLVRKRMDSLKIQLNTKYKDGNVRCAMCLEHKPPSDFYKGAHKTYCGSCLRNRGVQDRILAKTFCVNYLGSKCTKCGYNKCLTALEFHHIDPKEKDFNIARCISKSGIRWVDTKIIPYHIIKELDKCILLCSNCHREQHVSY